MNITLWIEGQEHGPYEPDQVAAAVRDGTINAQVLARIGASGKWKPLAEVFPAVRATPQPRRAKPTNWKLIGAVAAISLIVVAVGVGAASFFVQYRPKVTVTGQVFIVTRGGQNFKLGLVPVMAYAPQDIAAFADERLSALKAIRESSDIEDLAKGVKSFSPEFVTNALPRPSSSAKTDADGRFSLKCRKGDVLIAAGQREVFKDTERYVWVKRAEDGELMLSNDGDLAVPDLILNEIKRLAAK